VSVCPGWTINVVGFVNGNYDKFIGVDLRSDVSRTLVETASIDYAANWLVRSNLLLLRPASGWVIFDLESGSLAAVLNTPGSADPGRAVVSLSDYVALGSRLFQRANDLLLH
jgi:hypothetical protein